jgi:hypothetical protein
MSRIRNTAVNNVVDVHLGTVFLIVISYDGHELRFIPCDIKWLSCYSLFINPSYLGFLHYTTVTSEIQSANYPMSQHRQSIEPIGPPVI